jgi:hypothetical protein
MIWMILRWFLLPLLLLVSFLFLHSRNSKHVFYVQDFFFENRAVNIEKYGTARQAIDDNII